MCRNTLLALLALPLLALAQAPNVKGAGASFPSQVYQRWAENYARTHHVVVQYRATGSGDGIKQAVARSVAFGGTDAPLSAADLRLRKLVQVPTAVGGVVPVLNVRGIGTNQLVLSGALLADIFLGRVQRWNDPRIAELNPGVPLPSLTIQRVVRADRSGTSEGFSRYLASVSEGFASTAGASQQPKWPGQPITGEGNDGVIKVLQATEGAIAYVSFDRVQREALSALRLQNATGRAVAASEAGFRAAIRQSALHLKGDDQASVLNQPGSDSWPITLTTFVLIDAAPARAADVDGALRFFYWAFTNGDRQLAGTGFAPLPASVQARLAARFATVKPRDGAPLSYYKL
jgi:phosphate transport system substrate-binding protein